MAAAAELEGDSNDVWRAFPQVHLKIQTTEQRAPADAVTQTWKQMNNLLTRSYSFVRDAAVHRRMINPMKVRGREGKLN
jgi:hypothetical protein